MAQQRMIQSYDVRMQSRMSSLYYGDSNFFNYGYWPPGTTTQKNASENLVEKLLSSLPQKDGSILDVACGMGASTKLLLKYYPAEQITAINLSEEQLAHALTNAPGCNLCLMDAAHLGFPEESFDNILCVEAAFHFNTRKDFLREALRVLKPGGRLVMSDVLWTRKLHEKYGDGMPVANFHPHPADYQAGLESIGFGSCNVIDATRECFGGFRAHRARWFKLARRRGVLTAWEAFWGGLQVRITSPFMGRI